MERESSERDITEKERSEREKSASRRVKFGEIYRRERGGLLNKYLHTNTHSAVCIYIHTETLLSISSPSLEGSFFQSQKPMFVTAY